MSRTIARPEEFLQLLHCKDADGSIIFERITRRKKFQVRVPVFHLEKIVKTSCNVPDLFFSTARFCGHPLILNFHKSSAVSMTIPIKDYDQSTFMIMLSIELGKHDIPLPTVILNDGERETLVWILDEEVNKTNLGELCVIQQALYSKFKYLNADDSTQDITSLIRSVGSQNKKTGKNVGIRHFTGKKFDLERLKKALLNDYPADKFSSLTRQVAILNELHILWHERVWEIPRLPELYKDWIIFFGSALCKLCSPKQLVAELKAIAESLENSEWKKISGEYQELIDAFAESAHEGWVYLDDTYMKINTPHWEELVTGKLNITAAEADSLGLSILHPDQGNKQRGLIRGMPINIFNTFGYDHFEPTNRICISEVA